MAQTIEANRLTIVDIAKMSENGKIAEIAEVLSETNAIIQDMHLEQSTAPTTNTVTMRSSLPSVDYTRINQGVARSKGTTRQVKDAIGVLAGLSEIDVRAKIPAGGDLNSVRWNTDAAFLEAMAQKTAYTLLYGSEAVNEAAFTGFFTRMSHLTTGPYKKTTISCGGSGSDNTSMLIVDWHPRYCHGIYPQGSAAGLETEDLGENVRVTDEDGAPFQAAVTAFNWALGLSIRDPRHVARLCNIDVSDMATAGAGSDTCPNLIRYLIRAWHKMQPPNGACRCIYCAPEVLEAIDNLALNKTNLALGKTEWQGEEVTSFRGAPFRRVDQFLLNEAAVS